MRRLSTILFIFLGLAIATSEIPELCNLVDDPSNNAEPSVLEYCAALPREGSIVEAAEPFRPALKSVASHFIYLRTRTVIASHIPLFSARTGQDVLLLIRSLRT